MTEEERMSVPNPFRDMTEAQWKQKYHDYVSYIVTNDIVIGLRYVREIKTWVVMKRKILRSDGTNPSGFKDLSRQAFPDYGKAMEEVRFQVNFLTGLYAENTDTPVVNYEEFQDKEGQL